MVLMPFLFCFTSSVFKQASLFIGNKLNSNSNHQYIIDLFQISLPAFDEI